MFEINLVPDIKEQVIKAQKIRNFIFFVCMVVAAATIGVVLILLAIKSGQDINMASQDGKLEKMSAKLAQYGDLDEILTLQGQLNKIDEIGQNKKVFSRVFSIIGTLLPTNADKITISELTVNLGENTFTIKGQADAGEEPYIDYRVLEAFKKSMSVMKYDYGRFVDKNGNEIPTRCIIETDENGNALMEGNSQYVYWTKGKKGCDPSRNDELNTNSDEDEESEEKVETDEQEKIYRTPQFKEWYKAGYMTANGEINNVAHFRSECITYTGTGGNKPSNMTWVETNTCELTTGDRIVIDDDSSNARDESGNLVLKFNATIYLNEDVLSFKNKHMMAIAPSGRQNMTDSYLQIEGMFAKEAEECDPTDSACLNNQSNTGNTGE
ncbi:hypothetical protein IJI94_03290 [Candidatus Saccharibacteria bacterium]|nr:hypothetical protein [Candidatus Saccharibacteria bacterium]